MKTSAKYFYLAQWAQTRGPMSLTKNPNLPTKKFFSSAD